MPSTLTYTGKIGPAKTVTAISLSNVSKYIVDTAMGTLTVEQSSPSKTTCFDLMPVTTVTVTAASGVVTVTMS